MFIIFCTYSPTYPASSFENQFCKFAKHDNFVLGVCQNRACKFQARLKLTRPVLARPSSEMVIFSKIAKLVFQNLRLDTQVNM